VYSNFISKLTFEKLLCLQMQVRWPQHKRRFLQTWQLMVKVLKNQFAAKSIIHNEYWADFRDIRTFNSGCGVRCVIKYEYTYTYVTQSISGMGEFVC